MSRYDNKTSILPMGLVNIFTGHNKHFNIFEEWKGDDTTAEVWVDGNGNHFMIFTSGDTPTCKRGTVKQFKHNHTGRPLFRNYYGNYDATLVCSMLLKDIEKATEYRNTFRAYVYK